MSQPQAPIELEGLKDVEGFYSRMKAFGIIFLTLSASWNCNDGSKDSTATEPHLADVGGWISRMACVDLETHAIVLEGLKKARGLASGVNLEVHLVGYCTA